MVSPSGSKFPFHYSDINIALQHSLTCVFNPHSPHMPHSSYSLYSDYSNYIWMLLNCSLVSLSLHTSFTIFFNPMHPSCFLNPCLLWWESKKFPIIHSLYLTNPNNKAQGMWVSNQKYLVISRFYLHFQRENEKYIKRVLLDIASKISSIIWRDACNTCRENVENERNMTKWKTYVLNIVHI